MFKKIKITLTCILFSVALLSTNVYADPADTEDTSEEETTEEATNDDGGEWKEDENTGTWQYIINNTPVKGWYKINGIWYYFGSDGKMQTNTTVGPYIINEEGALTNGSDSPDFVPEPHGKVYNSSNAILLKDGSKDVNNVINKINELYENHKAGNTIEDKAIKEARYSYNSLTSAQKVKVNNESKLAELENIYGIQYDYDQIYATPSEPEETDGNVKKGTSYTFNIDDSKQNITIVVRFTTDANMDGIGDVPAINLVSPDGETIEINNISPQIRNASINTSLTWTDNFMQMDIASAENGTWTLMTDILCTFESREYAGNRTDLNPIPSEDEVHSPSKADPENKEEETTENKKSSSNAPLIFLAVAVAGFIGLFIWTKKSPAGDQKNKKSNKNAAPVTPTLSPTEEYEMLKAELSEIEKEFEDEEFQDDIVQPQQQPQPTNNMYNYSQEEINESIEEYNTSYDIYNAASTKPRGTNILTNEDEGYYNRPQEFNPEQSSVQEPVYQNTMPNNAYQSNVPVQQPVYQNTLQIQEQTSTENTYNEDDEWYEDEE